METQKPGMLALRKPAHCLAGAPDIGVSALLLDTCDRRKWSWLVQKELTTKHNRSHRACVLVDENWMFGLCLEKKIYINGYNF